MADWNLYWAFRLAAKTSAQSRVSVSRSIFALMDDRAAAILGARPKMMTRSDSSTIRTSAIFRRSTLGGFSIEMNRLRSGISERDELAERAGRGRKPGVVLPGKADVHGVNFVIQRL
jgi:hypothetical protein